MRNCRIRCALMAVAGLLLGGCASGAVPAGSPAPGPAVDLRPDWRRACTVVLPETADAESAAAAFDASPDPARRELRLRVVSDLDQDGWLHESRADRVVRRPSKQKRHSEYLSRIAAVTPAGRPAIEYRDYSVAWEDHFDGAGPEPATLERGRFRLVQKKDGSTVVDILAGDLSDSDLREFNLVHAGDLMLPAVPVAAGESWPVDSEALRRFLTRLGDGRHEVSGTGTLGALSGEPLADGLGRFAAVSVTLAMRGRIGTHSTFTANMTASLLFDRTLGIVVSNETLTKMTSKDGAGAVSGEATIAARVTREAAPPAAAPAAIPPGLTQ